MLGLTNGAGGLEWKELTRDWKIVGYIPGGYLVWDATEASPVSSPDPRVRPEIIEKARKILREHKDVWTELARY